VIAGVAAAAVSAALVAWAVMRARMASPPGPLMRTNVSGRPVPAVLGDAVAAGALAGLLGLWVGGTGRDRFEAGAAVAVVVAVMWAAGRADDLRGDERERGFKGHLRAAARGRLTGGVLKIVAGGASGLAAAALTTGGWDLVLVAATVALAANLFNLLDRAPGRAAKLWLLVMVPVLVAGGEVWTVAGMGILAATVVVLRADLKERAMLGDAGANPIGAVWGLLLAHALSTSGKAVALVILVALNAASEKWSFSAVIDRTPPLRAFDRLGRK
jgi:UDP-GlcNAc:undecaprenyl-phosphate/decaprenyl-phosphate GlcNAc-1-phosphate transferase